MRTKLAGGRTNVRRGRKKHRSLKHYYEERSSTPGVQSENINIVVRILGSAIVKDLSTALAESRRKGRLTGQGLPEESSFSVPAHFSANFIASSMLVGFRSSGRKRASVLIHQ